MAGGSGHRDPGHAPSGGQPVGGGSVPLLLVIPAGTWHVEWWETDTLEEITGVGPMRSDRA